MIPFTTTPKQKVNVYGIATKMAAAGLVADFVSAAVDLALEYEGAHDLLVLWAEEKDKKAREEIVADLQDEIDEHREAPSAPMKKPYVVFEDLDAIARNVMKFKKELRRTVDRWGGISKLAETTGIPQPSLSRFFHSAAMPRRTTLYRIADALKLKEGDVLSEWVA